MDPVAAAQRKATLSCTCKACRASSPWKPSCKPEPSCSIKRSGSDVPVDYRILMITINVLANQLGLPVPVIPTLIVAGAWAAQGTISPVALFASAIVACVCADSVWFLAGRIYGNGVMKLLCRISLTPDSCVSDTQSRFERWGSNALLVAKFVPG